VLAQQARDSTGQGAHHLVLAREHLAQIEFDVACLDAVRGQPVAQVVVVMGGIEERLGGNAANVEAGAAQRTAAFDAGDLHAQLCGTDCCDITARSSPDHDQIISAHVVSPPKCGSRPARMLPYTTLRLL